MKTLVKIQTELSGRSLRVALAHCGYELSADCGGMGTCGKCKVKLISGSLKDVSGSTILPSENDILACKCICTSDGATIELNSDVYPYETAQNVTYDSAEYTLAVDIGTTTIEIGVVDRESGNIVARMSANNPQAVFGADVLSRISAADESGVLDLMRQSTVQKLEEMIFTLCHGSFPKDGILAGNPTMTSLICGVSPHSLGIAPFHLPFADSREVRLENTGITLKTLPLASAFIGGDVLAGAALYNLDIADKPTLFADLGTNGEILLSANGKIYAASAAAGPALEGAGISCGMRADIGALRSLTRTSGGELLFKTVGDVPPVGIAASGLFDVISTLLETGDITSNGELLSDPYAITPDIAITADDVRAFLLAKAAFRAAIETILDKTGIKASDITRFFVGGGISEHLNRFSAARVGLFSPELAVIANPIGNSSLLGSARAACDPSFFEKISKLSKKVVTLSLADSSYFEDRFVREMSFPPRVDL